ncbi:MAG: 50S ribosomal protein L11 methyltransferase [Candidatus Omnitrophota bacterium]
MLKDKIRMTYYQNAISEVVKKGSVVLDIGTGSGILAYFAFQAGAKKIYAIEHGEIIEDAKKLAQLNRLNKKIIFLNGMSDKIELPEKVDVVISEILGNFGIEENVHKFTIDARKRFLKPGGMLMPCWLDLYLVPVESKTIWEENIEIWNNNFFGFNLFPIRNYAISQRYLTDCPGKDRFLSKPALISHSNFYEIDTMPSIFEAKFIINKTGGFQGWLGYFKAGLSKNIILSTDPKESVTHWKQVFFPIANTVRVKSGDEVYVKIKAIPRKNNIFWEWKTRIFRNKAEAASFSQTNFNITKEELVLGRADFKPALTPEAEIYRRILSLCDGIKTNQEIADTIITEYPKKYKTTQEALGKVTAIIRGNIKIS